MITSKDWKVGFVAVLAALSSVTALADGALSMSYRGRQGFSIMSVEEKNGIREGNVDNAYIGAYRTEKELNLALGSYKNTLAVSPSGTGLYYAGFLDLGIVTTINYYPDKDGFRMRGEVGGTEFNVQVNQKKGELLLYWDDKKYDVEFQIDLRKTSATEPGSCTGKFSAFAGTSYEELAVIYCHSSGSMEDSLFSNPDDVIAFILRLQVQPTEDDGGDDPFPTP